MSKRNLYVRREGDDPPNPELVRLLLCELAREEVELGKRADELRFADAELARHTKQRDVLKEAVRLLKESGLFEHDEQQGEHDEH